MQNFSRSVKTAVLIDGAFYRKRAKHFNGSCTPEERAEELWQFCLALLKYDKNEYRDLYRVFYYDCPPIGKNIFDPVSKKTIDLSKSDEYQWMTDFLEELKCRRKFALRLGRLSENTIEYTLKYDVLKKLLSGDLDISDITLSDLKLNIEQKGVDMRIGVDISSLTMKKQVNQIILISGDSDFVPAAKLARREGVDFLLSSMGAPIKKDLFEHIDGLIKATPKPYVAN